jgi:hypothetical protein
VTEWEPATEAEAAMRDALRMADQEQYFRILGRTELLLPVSTDALAGRAPMGWGTWNSGGRTHVLAFTSPEAMRVCLAENAGPARRIAYQELARTWPNHEWWLAVNPGLPIEGYLPPWFVSQLARGDVRLPGRTSGRVRATAPPPVADPRPNDGPTAYGDESRNAPAAQGTIRGTAAAPPPPATTPSNAAATVASPAPLPAIVPAIEPVAANARIIEDGEVVTPPAAPRRTTTRTPNGRPDRRPRRREAAIIDAEIIESTVLGRTALDATVVSATVVGSLVDEAVIDAEVIDSTVVDGGATATRRTTAGTPSGADAPRDTAAAKPAPFVPANEVEENLVEAVGNGKTDTFLSTLLLAKVLIPIPTGESTDVRPDSPVFPWRREVFDGQPYLVVFTSPERMREFMGAEANTVTAKFVQLIRYWPDANWAFAVNPGSPVGATLPGAQIKALSAWAEDEGLTDDEPDIEVGEPAPPPPPTTIVMQKPVAPSQVAYYLERGYDRVSGFVHRAIEVVRLRTPDQIYAGLGLSYSGTPFDRDATEIYVLRWSAHRGDLYRIPYGGQHEAAMRAMQGWMIERAPFRGNGFAPAERGEVIAEFKVDSIRLPHGAQMWRLSSSGERSLIAVLDADECQWRSAREAGVEAEWDPTVPPQRNRAALARYQAPAARQPEPPNPADDPLDPRWRPARAGGR